MHKQSQLKDQEITHLQGRQADYEKRMVLIQQQSRDNHLLQKMHEQGGSGSAHLKSLMMPFSSCAAVNRSGYGAANGFTPQGGIRSNFYSQRVHKPIQGGGRGKAALDRSSQGMNFSEFMEKNQSQKMQKHRSENYQKDVFNQNNRFRSMSKTAQLISKKDQKKQNLMNNVPGFGGATRDSRLENKSAVRPQINNSMKSLQMRGGSSMNLQN